jgi:hypothetical protein
MIGSAMAQLRAVTLLAAVDAANTAAATSAYVDVRGFEGQVAVILDTGILDDGTMTYTFNTATDAGAAGTAAIVPIGGAPTVVSTANDPLVQVAVFEVSQLKGFLQVVGTKSAAGGVLVSYTAVGIRKYGG